MVAKNMDDIHTEINWDWAQKEAMLFDRWLVSLEPTMAGVVPSVLIKPVPADRDNTMAVRRELFRTFAAVLESLPGTRMDKYRKLKSPRMLRHYAGLATQRLDEREWCLELLGELSGRETHQDHRSRAVIEPETGSVWSSATELATDLGCAKISVYQHLSKRLLPTLRGRVFEYVDAEAPRKAVPGSIAAMTEEEKEESRARTRAAGFEPRF